MATGPALSLQSRLIFGKYKGLTVEMVIRQDWSYVQWLIENDVILLSNEAFELYRRVSGE